METFRLVKPGWRVIFSVGYTIDEYLVLLLLLIRIISGFDVVDCIKHFLHFECNVWFAKLLILWVPSNLFLICFARTWRTFLTFSALKSCSNNSNSYTEQSSCESSIFEIQFNSDMMVMFWTASSSRLWLFRVKLTKCRMLLPLLLIITWLIKSLQCRSFRFRFACWLIKIKALNIQTNFLFYSVQNR